MLVKLYEVQILLGKQKQKYINWRKYLITTYKKFLFSIKTFFCKSFLRFFLFLSGCSFQCIPSRHKTSSRHLRIVLGLSCLDKTFLRHLQDVFMQMNCNRHFQDILILSQNRRLDKTISRCLDYVFIKKASIKHLQDSDTTESQIIRR